MTPIRSKFLMSVLASTFALAASAGQEKGNGGDAVVLTDGHVVLFDFYERGVDADAFIQRRLDSDHADAYGLNSLAENLAIGGPEFMNSDRDDGKKVQRAIAIVLDEISERFPALVWAIVEEGKRLRWTQAAASILPNPDTQPFLDPTQFRRIGCARNISRQVVYSPECTSAQMSPAQKAGLVLHEIIYSLYREAKPDSDNSFNVRTIVSKMFDSPDLSYYTFEDVLKDSGLGAIITQNDALNATFYLSAHTNDSPYFVTYFDCTFANNRRKLREIHLEFSGAMDARGELVFSKRGEPTEQPLTSHDRVPTVDGKPAEHYWNLWVPRYDLDKKTMGLTFEEAADNGRFNLTMNFNAAASRVLIEGTYSTYINHDEEVIYPVHGSCRQLPSRPHDF